MSTTAQRLREAELERIVLEEIRSLPQRLIPVDEDHPVLAAPRAPRRAWRSRHFVVQLFDLPGEGGRRLSVQRSRATQGVRPANRDLRPISWDELMAVKFEVGFGDTWAAELYPPDDAVVDVAPMRHLWLLAGAPAFGWVTPAEQLRASPVERAS